MANNLATSPQVVGVGLVGAGAFGAFCAEAFAAMPEVHVVAIADSDLARATQLAFTIGAAAYPSLETLLTDERVQIVALNTPPSLHAGQGMAVLRAGKHLFCEKPLALTVEEGEALVAEAEARDLRLTVDYVMRHNPFWQAAARLRADGVLGRLLHLDLANHAAGLDLPATHWFWDAGQSGGIWVEHGVHFFDAFAWVAGENGTIIGSQAFARADGRADRVECLARFGDSAAHFYHGFTHSGQTEQTTATLTFERGYVTLREWIPTSIEIITSVSADVVRPYLPGAETHIEQTNTQTRIVNRAPEGKSALYRAAVQAGMRDLVRAVQQPDHALAVNGRDGLASLQLAVEATKIAARSQA